MKRFIKPIAATLLMGAGVMGAMASPADPTPRPYEQPDGSSVTLSLIGDEAFHCLLTPDGYVAVGKPDGFYYFVGNDGRPTNFRVSDGAPASLNAISGFEAYKNANRNAAFAQAQQNEFSTRALAKIDKLGNSKWDNTDGHDLREVNTEGELHVLVILVNFSDTFFSVSSDPKALVSDMLNKENFTAHKATGSVYDYFRDISWGQFHPIFDVYGPVNLDKKSVEYVKTDETRKDENGKDVAVYAPGRMVEEACKKLDDEIDFSKYDANNDGVVDFVYIFHAGKGATTGGNTDTTIWPHAFTLTAAIGAPIELDGVKVNRYATSSEVGRSSNELNGIGMFCHEFSHVLGLPDLYDTANNGTATKVFSPGSFSNMDAGNYNNNIHTPPMFSAYEQYALEWMLPTTITGAGNFTLLPQTARPFAYKVNTKRNPQEYYLFEARAPHRWDEYLEGFGMLVWHIDFDEKIWADNKVNNQANHQRIDIVEADDSQNITSRSGDPFPGIGGVNEFLSNTNPAFVDWSRNDLGFEILNIMSHPDGTVTFRVESTNGKEMEGAQLDAVVPNVFDVTADKAELNWKPVENADGYMVSVFNMDSFDGEFYKDYVDGWHFNDVKGKTTITIDGLKPNVNYGVMVYAYNDMASSRMSSPLQFVSHAEDFATTAPGIYTYKNESGVLLGWDAVADASHYELTVATRAAGETAETITASFDDSKAPAGWRVTGRYENRANYCGKSAPSVQLNETGSTIRTAEFDRDIKSISFWARLPFLEPGLSLEIYGVDEAGHTSIITTLDDFKTAAETYTIDIPEGYRQATFRLVSSVSGLGLYIDDIDVALTDGHKDTPVSGYDARKVEGNNLEVTGLEPNTSYVAYVRACKGEDKGRRSKAIEFVPSKVTTAGVDDIICDENTYDEADVKVANGRVSANGNPFAVYTMDGRMIASGVKALTLPGRGVYIVKVADKTKKIAW